GIPIVFDKIICMGKPNITGFLPPAKLVIAFCILRSPTLNGHSPPSNVYSVAVNVCSLAANEE
ncbi:hypothetical protein, partial [Parabacteroides sp.]